VYRYIRVLEQVPTDLKPLKEKSAVLVLCRLFLITEPFRGAAFVPPPALPAGRPPLAPPNFRAAAAALPAGALTVFLGLVSLHKPSSYFAVRAELLAHGRDGGAADLFIQS